MRVTTVTAGRAPSVAALLEELWQYRALIWAFSSKDLRVKYAQTIFGPLWVIATPLITVGVMTFVFGFIIKIPTDDLPYILFYLVAIVPWFAFTNVFYASLSSLEANAAMFSKIYFPRLVIGASYAINGTIDFLVGYVVAVGLSIYFHVFSLGFLLVMPVLLYIQMAWALGLGLLLAPYNAQYRDVRHAVPLAVQLYFFASPILYPSSAAPEWVRWLYKVNPLAALIETYRAFLNGHPVHWLALAYSIFVSTGALFWGAYVFMRKDQNMVDVL
jgi:lipopolysaccharide transport system permease protein